MLNPLSLQYGQICSGKQINDWCHYQVDNNGSHFKDAAKLLKKKYKNDRMYRKSYKAKTAGLGEPDIIEFRKINETVV